MRRLVLPILLTGITLVDVACYKAGTLGGGDLHKFDCTRGELQNCLDSMVFRNWSLTPPFKWMHYNNWEEKGYGFLHGVTFYFNAKGDNGERMYYVTLIDQDEGDTTWTKPSYLAVRSIFIEEERKFFWKTLSDVDEKERKLAESRIAILASAFGKMCGCNEVEVIRKED